MRPKGVKNLCLEDSSFYNVTTTKAGAILKMDEMAYFENYLRNLKIDYCFSMNGAVLDIGITFEVFILENL